MVSDELRRAEWALASVFFTLGFGGGNYVARVPMLRAHLGLDDQQLGMFLLCGGIGAVTAFRTASPWVARVHSRGLAAWGSIVAAVLLFVPAYTPHVALAGLANFIGGYGNGLVDVSINANAVQIERRAARPVLSKLHGLCSLGSFCGAACGTLAAVCHLSLLWHFVAVGVVITLASLWAQSRMLPDEPATDAPASAAPFTPALLCLGAVAFCSSVGEGAMAQWTAIFLHDDLGASDAVAAFGYAVYAAAMVIGRLLGDRLAVRVSAPVMLRYCGCLSAGSLAVALIFDTPSVTIPCYVGVGAGLAMVIPLVFRTAAAAAQGRPSAAISAVATLSYGGFLLGPPSIGLVAHHANLRAALWLVVALMACLALVAGVLRRWLTAAPRA